MCSFFPMKFSIVFFLLFISISHREASSHQFTIDGTLLELDDKTFYSAISTFDYILVDFYAPWQSFNVVNNEESGYLKLVHLADGTILKTKIVEKLVDIITFIHQEILEIFGENGYNAERLPLAKLSKSTILKGYDVSKRISDVIGQSDRTKLEQLSGEFYTIIPHDLGFKKMHLVECHPLMKLMMNQELEISV